MMALDACLPVDIILYIMGVHDLVELAQYFGLQFMLTILVYFSTDYLLNFSKVTTFFSTFSILYPPRGVIEEIDRSIEGLSKIKIRY